jgi:hypothetical protein
VEVAALISVTRSHGKRPSLQRLAAELGGFATA